MACLTLLLTGTIPPSTISQPIDDEDLDQPSPFAIPTIFVTSVLHSACAVYLYVWYSDVGLAGFLLGFLASAGLACFGLWCLVFGSGPGRISKSTGADKRTSGFPFKNVESDRKKVGRRKQF